MKALRRGGVLLFGLCVMMMMMMMTVTGCKKSKPKPLLAPMYCEGGVDDDGHGKSSTCVVIELSGRATDGIVGTARLSERYEDRFEIRVTAPTKYTLHKDGKKVGTLDQGGNWVTVTMEDGTNYKKSMRCDMPGVFE